MPHSSAHNTAATQASYAPPAQRWRAYRQALHPHRYQITPTRRTLYRSTQPSYYNKVYKGAPCYRSMPDSATYRRPYQPGGVSCCRLWIAGKCWQRVSSTDPAHPLRGHRLHLYRVSPAACNLAPAGALHPAGQSGSGAAGGAEPLTATAVSFSGFRPIANRGQQ